MLTSAENVFRVRAIRFLVRKILASVICPPAIPGPEMAAPSFVGALFFLVVLGGGILSAKRPCRSAM